MPLFYKMVCPLDGSVEDPVPASSALALALDLPLDGAKVGSCSGDRDRQTERVENCERTTGPLDRRLSCAEVGVLRKAQSDDLRPIALKVSEKIKPPKDVRKSHRTPNEPRRFENCDRAPGPPDHQLSKAESGVPREAQTEDLRPVATKLCDHEALAAGEAQPASAIRYWIVTFLYD